MEEIKANSFDEIKVDKRPGNRYRRIDPVDACINAHALRLMRRRENPVDVDDALSAYLKTMKPKIYGGGEQ